jgi:alkylation response protein AidB-like acyl-CoA dehydrogenase
MGSADDRVDVGRTLLAQLDEGGWAVPTWPVEHGGRAATATQAGIFHQELARFETPDLYPFMVGISLVGPTLLTHGNPGQQARWLPAIRAGEEIWCQLFSEPNAGSDLAGLEARATRDGDEWRVTGQKVWSSRAHYSEWGLLLARTDPTVPKHAGITAFALDMRAAGVEVRPLRQMNGDAHFNEVFMSDAPVRDADRIGDVGDGWRVAITTLMHERSAIGGGGGVTKARLVELTRAWGASDDPLVRQRLANVITRMEVDRATAGRARAAMRAGRPPGPEGSGAKLRMGATLKAMADLALDLRRHRRGATQHPRRARARTAARAPRRQARAVQRGAARDLRWGVSFTLTIDRTPVRDAATRLIDAYAGSNQSGRSMPTTCPR